MQRLVHDKIRKKAKANTIPYRTDNLYEHSEEEPTGLAFNGCPKLLLFSISLRQLPRFLSY